MMNFPNKFPGTCVVLLVMITLLRSSGILTAHPMPEVPVRGFFEANGTVRIQVEVETRCFAEVPMDEVYLEKRVFDATPETEKAALLAKAEKFVADVVEFRFLPDGKLVPDFTYRFGKLGGEELSDPLDAAVIFAEWSGKVPKGTTGYQVLSKTGHLWAVPVQNQVHGKKVERESVLFPGEDSFVLDLTQLTAWIPSFPFQLGIASMTWAGLSPLLFVCAFFF